MPWGRFRYQGALGKASSASTFATTGTHTTYQDEGLSTSVTYQSGRTLFVSWQSNLYQGASATNDIYVKFIRGSTDIYEAYFDRVVLSTASVCAHSLNFYITTSSAATETFKTQIRCSANSAVQSNGYATAPKMLLIQDIGPS